MRVSDLLEAPIEDFNLIGNWDRNSSFKHPSDRSLLTNPKAVAKIKQKWLNTVVPFNLMFINAPEVNKERTREVGRVDQEWLQQNMPKTLPQLTIRPDAVNVIFTNNSGSERVPMTAWVIAHRLGHTFWRNDSNASFVDAAKNLDQRMTDILRDAYGLGRVSQYDWEKRRQREFLLRALYQHIGTMRSAREKRLRNNYEFIYELLAQYMLTGGIKFNPLPPMIRYGERGMLRAYLKPGDYQYYLDSLGDELSDEFENALRSAVGEIYVM